ncbi:MAG: stimulus-sensing domain-containing protein [Alphaproteobacteria bacterium]
MDAFWGGPERRISGLTVRIIAVNAAALVMLMIGIFYLSQYQESLIEAKLETFGTEVELVSAALSAGAHNTAQAENMAHELSLAMQQRIIVFDADGTMITDSYSQLDAETVAHFRDIRARKKYYTVQVLEKMASFLIGLAPDSRALPLYPQIESAKAADYPDAGKAMTGRTSISAWSEGVDRDILLSAATPLEKNGRQTGAVLLTRPAPDIEKDIGIVWMNIIKSFVITLALMIVLSIYLSGTIARPRKKLARAAEAARTGHGGNVDIPDFSDRNDEIGELSLVLRETTQALLNRMDSIQNFASDVAHELKNPLTSVRSAVETLSVVKDSKDQERMVQIIHQDVARMDRLITDISSISRLDAELSRDKFEQVDLRTVFHTLIESYKDPLERKPGAALAHNTFANVNGCRIRLDIQISEDLFVWGLESRLLQLFHNLISNALSFSPPNGTIALTAGREKDYIVVSIRDQGPGIPENKLQNIFDRFYTERPKHESYGRHSGLGLSICRQILEAQGGEIFAENIRDSSGEITGAQFTVILGAL